MEWSLFIAIYKTEGILELKKLKGYGQNLNEINLRKRRTLFINKDCFFKLELMDFSELISCLWLEKIIFKKGR